MVLSPSLLVADEPVSSLDASVRGEILALMLRLVRETDVGDPRRHPRPRAGLERRRPRGGDVPRADRRAGPTEERAHRPAPPLHARAALGGARGRARSSRRSYAARRPTRRASRPAVASTRAARSWPPARRRAWGSRSAAAGRTWRSRRCPTRPTCSRPATRWPAPRCRRDGDAALPLVHRPRGRWRAERARLFAPRVAVRRAPRAGRRARLATSPAAPATCRSWWCATATACCARSSTSAATAAPRSSRAPGAARRCSATTTRGRTASTARCARRRARRASGSTAPRSACAGRASTRGGRSSSSTRRRTPPPLADTLGAMPVDRGRAAGSTSTPSCSTTARSTGCEANWKVRVENFLECYHCAVAHPGFADVIDVDHDAYRLERHPTFASHFAHVRDAPARRALRRGRDRRPVPPRVAGAEGQRHARARQPVDRPADAGRARGAPTGVLDYFFAARRGPRVDRGLHGARRRGRRRGPRARRVRAARDGRRRASRTASCCSPART